MHVSASVAAWIAIGAAVAAGLALVIALVSYRAVRKVRSAQLVLLGGGESDLRRLRGLAPGPDRRRPPRPRRARRRASAASPPRRRDRLEDRDHPVDASRTPAATSPPRVASSTRAAPASSSPRSRAATTRGSTSRSSTAATRPSPLSPEELDAVERAMASSRSQKSRTFRHGAWPRSWRGTRMAPGQPKPSRDRGQAPIRNSYDSLTQGTTVPPATFARRAAPSRPQCELRATQRLFDAACAYVYKAAYMMERLDQPLRCALPEAHLAARDPAPPPLHGSGGRCRGRSRGGRSSPGTAHAVLQRLRQQRVLRPPGARAVEKAASELREIGAGRAPWSLPQRQSSNPAAWGSVHSVQAYSSSPVIRLAAADTRRLGVLGNLGRQHGARDGR